MPAVKCSHGVLPWDLCDDCTEELRNERDRYRAALEWIRDAKPSDYKPTPYPGGVRVVFRTDYDALQDIAREALGEETP
jgi:hypothetical protein